MIEIRPETGAAIATVHALNACAFAGEAEARPVDDLRAARDLLVSLVAVHGTDIVGHILFSPLPVETGGGIIPAAALAPLADDPA